MDDPFLLLGSHLELFRLGLTYIYSSASDTKNCAFLILQFGFNTHLPTLLKFKHGAINTFC